MCCFSAAWWNLRSLGLPSGSVGNQFLRRRRDIEGLEKKPQSVELFGQHTRGRHGASCASQKKKKNEERKKWGMKMWIGILEVVCGKWGKRGNGHRERGNGHDPWLGEVFHDHSWAKFIPLSLSTTHTHKHTQKKRLIFFVFFFFFFSLRIWILDKYGREREMVGWEKERAIHIRMRESETAKKVGNREACDQGHRMA